MSDLPILLSIAVLGGTGKEGKGLAYRWAKAGYHVYIGSRAEEKAKAAAQELWKTLEGQALIEGMSNAEAAQKADIIVLSVPYSAHRETLDSIKTLFEGKLLIDVTAPLEPPKTTKVE